jgi:hypothetical protein
MDSVAAETLNTKMTRKTERSQLPSTKRRRNMRKLSSRELTSLDLNDCWQTEFDHRCSKRA